MVKAVPDILARIVDHKRAELAEARPRRGELEKRAASRTDFRDFRAALKARPPAIIAEIKKASPSKGVLTQQFDPASIARIYAQGGAAALSVLTDRDFFQGSLDHLKAACAAAPVPVLRKDFTIDEFHIVEAAAHGADAILLIAALLDERTLRDFRELAAQFRLAALVEVHDESELAAAIDSGAENVGVNNRNLHTFEVKLETSLRLLEKIPSDVVKVAESGIESREDVRRLAGFDAFLVGEHLMRSSDPAAALRELRS
ncbi:MAG TPA: indole-3-glycerol phosphate synthase TrpC [Bryobacteraceae bacterium]|nr:indole-3-glycerol phosphate synthase TrpC [Bryobacteraceae bacterium]